MEAENKICQNCKKEFTIESEDFKFYEKINVPLPTWCPECRMIRRFACQNIWSLFWRKCDKCGKKILAKFSPNRKIMLFCPDCWWADDWDGTEYAMDYDPSRSFFEQLKELSEKTPYVSLASGHLTLKNSDFCNYIGWSKNCYMVFWADFCEEVFYSSILNNLKWSSDCLRTKDSELCYEGVGLYKGYNVFFSDECDACVNVWFSRDCYSCTDCFGCVNLRGASNCIFNVKYSKEEYAKKLKELNLESWLSLKKLEKKAYEFWLTKPYREHNGHSLNLNTTGEHIYNSKNSKECYIVNGAENCKYTQFITVAPAKDSMDYSGWGNNASQIYESDNVGENSDRILFSYGCFPDCFNLEYCFQNIAGKNNFGCFNLKRKKYCILNKQYSKEEYEKLRQQIIDDMQKNLYIDDLGRSWSYGEFFPLSINKFSYNTSDAVKFFPKTKAEVLAEGYVWDEYENPAIVPDTRADQLPDTIKETLDLILEKIIECAECKRAYRFTTGELNLLRKLNLPLPHECPKCRENKRFERMTKPGMYNRNCDKCGLKIYTPYKPEDPRIVYCVKCYQAEFA